MSLEMALLAEILELIFWPARVLTTARGLGGAGRLAPHRIALEPGPCAPVSTPMRQPRWICASPRPTPVSTDPVHHSRRSFRLRRQP